MATAAAVLAAATLTAVARMPADGARRAAAPTARQAVIAAPDHLAIPNGTAAPSLDGRCDDAAYAETVRRTLWLGATFPDTAVEVRIARIPGHVFVCLAGLTADAGTFAAVYVDPDQSRDALAQAADTMVSVFQPGTTPAITTRRGNGAGDYTAFTAPANAVAGASASSAPGRWDAEIRLAVTFLGGDGHGIGLAAAEMWAGGVPGNDKLWPTDALWNEPRGWAAALLDIRARRAVGSADADAFVRRTYDTGDTATFGAQPNLIVGSRSMGDFYFTWRSLLRVARPALPPGSTLVAATLELRQTSGDNPDGQAVSIEACRAATDWTEPSVHWNNQPNVATPCVVASVGRAANAWVQWDVTTFAEAWYGGQTDRGVRLRRTGDENEAQRRRDFASREDADPSRRPRLVIQYVIPTTPTATATTRPPTTRPPTTPAPTTAVPTTPPPTTRVPTTPPPATTPAPTTAVPSPTFAVPDTPTPTVVTPDTPTSTPTVVLPGPTDLTCTAVAGTIPAITLEWADHSFEDAFHVERSDAGGAWRQIASVGFNTTTYVDRDIVTNTSYAYRVFAYFDASARRSEPSNTTICSVGTPKTPPRNLRCVARDVDTGARWSMDLSWLNDVAYDEYAVERALDGGGFVPLDGTTAHPGRTAIDPDVPAMRRATYRVRGHQRAADAFSDYSDVAECSTFARPSDAPVLRCQGIELAAKVPPVNWGIHFWWQRLAGTAGDIHVEHESGGAWGEIGAFDMATSADYVLGDREPAFRHGDVVRLRARAHRHGPEPQFSAYSEPVACAAGFDRKPVVIVPGYGGSQLTSCYDQSFGGTDYDAFEDVWLPQGIDVTDILDGYFDFLGLGEDGETPPIARDGRPACLSVRTDHDGRDGAMMRLRLSWLVKSIVDDDILEGMHDHLKDLGYRDGVDLFFLPYDFRRGVGYGTDILHAGIEAIKDRTGADQVDIVAHSMGGLVARRVVLDYGGDDIRQVITLGTPLLGAPKATANLVHPGDLSYALEDKLRYWLGIEPSPLLAFIRTWRGTYNLVPSPLSFGDPEGTGRGGPYVRVQPKNSATSVMLDQVQTTAYLAERTSASLLDAGLGEVDRAGDLSIDADEPVQHVIVGTGIATIGEVHDGWHWLIDPDGGDDALVHHTQGMPTACGDGTVPMDSALGANALDLYRRGGIHLVRYVEHMALPAHDQVQYLVGLLLEGKQVPPRIWNDSESDRASHGSDACYDRAHDPALALRPAGGAFSSAAAARRIRIQVIGDVSVVVTDTLGRTSPSNRRAGPDAGDGIPRLTRSVGEHATLLDFEAPDAYTLTVRSLTPRGLVQVRISALVGMTTTHALVYPSASVGRSSVLTLALPLPEMALPAADPVLRLRRDAASAEVLLRPLARLQGTECDDRVGPVVTLTVDDARRVTLRAADDPGGAGVHTVYYSTDARPRAFRPYSGPFQLPDRGDFVTAFAIDRAGNSSLPKVTTVHTLYLPRVVNPAASRIAHGSSRSAPRERRRK